MPGCFSPSADSTPRSHREELQSDMGLVLGLGSVCDLTLQSSDPKFQALT